MEGFRDRISTSPPAPARPSVLLHRTCILFSPIGCSRRVIYNRDGDSVAGILGLRNARTSILFSMPVQDSFPEGSHISTPCRIRLYALAEEPNSLALEEDTPRTVSKTKALDLYGL